MIIAEERKYIKEIITKIKRKFKISNFELIKCILEIKLEKQNNSYVEFILLI